ncbi:MAG: sugar ABC transporter ATP-binding protein [Chloroflexi bacterium]|nr:sugar ABC transporter ATP-binding protein [Chloroflexota bacterium]
MIMTTESVILHAEKVTKVYPGTVALQDVDFNIYPGKVNVLIGENGAGKSTLMKILAGVESPTSGTLLLDGKPITVRSPREASRHGIGIIYQELNLYPNLSVSENIFMARELVTPTGMIREAEQQRITRELMQRLELDVEPKTLVGDLRIGQQQIIEIAKALAQNVRILIMDEPTSALSNTEVEVLFRIIRELKAQNVSIVYISHKLDELLQIGDYFTVLRDGHLVAEAPASDVSLNWIVEKMVGRRPEALFHRSDHAATKDLLRVDNLSLPRSGGGYVVDHVSFSVRSGEILGIYGLMGAGRTELLESLIGLHPEASGSIWLDGATLTNRDDIRTRIRKGLALIPEDRQLRGLVQKQSVAHNITLASLTRFLNRFYLSARKEKAGVQQEVGELRIKVSDVANLVTSLSGGNQQKVVVGKSLLTEPKVLMMDEPTRGIDVAAKGEIFEIMNQLALKGLAVVFVSSELKEVLAMADRVLVMAKGCITAEFDRSELTQEAIVAASVRTLEEVSA